VADDDPGRDIGMMRQPGHRFFYFPEEIEPLGPDEPAQPPAAASAPAILIACIGNIFLGDDGFGVEVAQRLSGRSWPVGVQVMDFGIRGLDLAYALMDGPGATIFVDACPRGDAPGTVYLIEPDLHSLESTLSAVPVDAHSMNPMSVLRMAKSLGGELKRILLLVCEPETLGPDEGQMGLSEPVESAVAKAVDVLETLIPKILNGEWPASSLTN
jgi:hydrogenase maturation protease